MATAKKSEVPCRYLT